MPRVYYPLNFEWSFQKKNSNDIQKVDIPHNNVLIPYNYFNEIIYQFQSVYTKEFTIDVQKDHVYFIHFDGVLHQADVFINNQFVGSNHNGYSSFEFEITNNLMENNTIRVEVDSSESLNQPPFGQTIDYLTFGGIYREVTIIQKPINYIKDVRITQTNLLDFPTIELVVETTGGKELEVEIYDTDLVFQKTYSLNEEIIIRYPFDLWDIDNPKMYTIQLTLDHKDVYTFDTGFKESVFKKDGFYLNGKKVKITGLNRHQIYPYVGYAMPKQAQIDDAELLKTLGNAVRTAHYPQSKHFLNRCDEIGLLVFIEAPGWQYVGNQEWQTRYLDSIRRMVNDNKHHPSIVLWGARVNESGDYHELYKASNDIIRTLDQRQSGGVRCFSFSEMLEDVYTYNDFFHNGENDYLKNLDEIIEEDYPYLITEFNGHMFPTKSFDHSDRRLEHSLRYAHILNAVNKNNRICGSFGWNFADYYTHNEFGSGDHICHHGVVDLFRIPKEAAYVYQSQLADSPYIEILNNAFIGDYNVGYIDKFVIATNCESVVLYQNDRRIGTFYPDRKTFPHLKHPLIIIDDLFGEIKKSLQYSEKEMNELIVLGKRIASYGGLDKITKSHNIDSQKARIAWSLYGKYVANWGSQAFVYTIVGNWKGNTITRKFGPYQDKKIQIKKNQDVLKFDDTYGVMKIDIIATDEFNNTMPYAFDGFKISTKGPISVIGDTYISLIGGKRSFWVKSKHEGNAQVMIENDSFSHKLQIKIEQIKKEKL